MIPPASNYIQHLIAEKQATQSAHIRWLSALGWTQGEIGEALGLTQRGTGKIIEQCPEWDKVLKTQLSAGHPVETTATNHLISVQYAWRFKLDGKSDQEKLSALGIKIQPYDCWTNLSGHPDPGNNVHKWPVSDFLGRGIPMAVLLGDVRTRPDRGRRAGTSAGDRDGGGVNIGNRNEGRN